MVNTQETNNQQPSVLIDNKDEGSETISKESRGENLEAVSILTSNVEDKDIVQKSKAFYKYLEKSNKMFNNKFDYSKFIYVTAKTKGIIICPIHGEYLQNMDKHTAKNSKGCQKCWNENRPYPLHLKDYVKKIKPFNVFKEEADKIFQNKFVYDESTYQGFSKKFKITCTKHGDFLISPEVF